MKVLASDGAKVTLDGDPVEQFISADTEAGWVRISHDVVKRGMVAIVKDDALSDRGPDRKYDRR
jgi:hypothetical protein